MVSGLVTSPCDQLRIFSGDARLIRMASKSAIGFAISKGLERNKVVLRFLRRYRCRFTALKTVVGHWPSVVGHSQRNFRTYQLRANLEARILNFCVDRRVLVLANDQR